MDFSSLNIVSRSDITALSTTVIPGRDLTAGPTYYWSVRARNQTGPGDWSETFSFSIDPPPSAPTLDSPSDGASFNSNDMIEFMWSMPSSASSYMIRIGRTMDFSSPNVVSDSVNTLSTIVNPGPFIAGQTYYWSVRARNQTGPGDWSETFSFSIDPPPTLTIFGRDGVQDPFANYIEGNGNAFANQNVANSATIPGLSVSYEADQNGNAGAALTAVWDGTEASQVYFQDLNNEDVDLSLYSSGSLLFDIRVNDTLPTADQLRDSFSWRVELGNFPNHAPVDIETDIASLTVDIWTSIEVPISCFDAQKTGTFDINAVPIPFLMFIGHPNGFSDDFPSMNVSLANIRISPATATTTRTGSGCPTSQP